MVFTTRGSGRLTGVATLLVDVLLSGAAMAVNPHAERGGYYRLKSKLSGKVLATQSLGGAVTVRRFDLTTR